MLVTIIKERLFMDCLMLNELTQCKNVAALF